MAKKFKVLRIIATMWKVLAWIALSLGIIGAFGTLLASIFGGGFMGQMMRQYGQQGGPWATGFGIVGGVITFVVMLITAAFYSLMLYAVGEMICLFLDIEENTRITAQWLSHLAPQTYVPASSAYSTPPPAYPTPPPSYPTPVPGQL